MNNEATGTSAQNVNIPSYGLQPRNMRLTPRGTSNVPMSQIFPKVLGGQCEYCGTLDPYQPGEYQYKLCPHYRGMDLKCVYCPLSKNADEVVKNSTLHVHEHPYRRGELVVRCESFECIRKHEQAFPQ